MQAKYNKNNMKCLRKASKQNSALTSILYLYIIIMIMTMRWGKNISISCYRNCLNE